MQSTIMSQQQETANREEERNISLATRLNQIEQADSNTRDHVMRELRDMKQVNQPGTHTVPIVQSTPFGYISVPSIPRMSTSPIGLRENNIRSFRETTVQEIPETQHRDQEAVPLVPL